MRVVPHRGEVGEEEAAGDAAGAEEELYVPGGLATLVFSALPAASVRNAVSY